MQDITLGPFDDNGFIFDIGALGRQDLPDMRGAQGRVYPLARILTCVLLARLCGENATRIANKRFAELQGCVNKMIHSHLSLLHIGIRFP